MEDDSTLNEWRIRHSIDVMIRFMCFVLMVAIQVGITALEGSGSVEAESESQFESKLGLFIFDMSLIF